MTIKQRFFILLMLLSSIVAIAQQKDTINIRGNFIVNSTAFINNGTLPKLYTCDSTGISPSIGWANAPRGTKAFAITMHHIAKDSDRHVYLILYDIPENVTSIPDGVNGVGKFGTNTVDRRTRYTPPCSKGPGPKKYTITVYALSETGLVSAPGPSVNMDVLLESIKDKTLARASVDVIYSR